MNISFFSFLMALLCSMVFIVIVHFLRNREAFLKGFGVPTVLLLYALCIGRVMLPIEFPFTMPVRVQNGYNQFYRAISQPVLGGSVSLLEIAGWIWLAGAVLCLARFMVKYFVSMLRLRRFENVRNPLAEDVLETIKQETGKNGKIHLFVYPKTESPQGVGLFRKSILLPPGEWTREELYYILLHEYTHFLNHDQAVKFLLTVFRCVFWWNPLAYLLKSDVAKMLEIKCDLTVIKGFRGKRKEEYMDVLLDALKQAERKSGRFGFTPVSTQLFKHEGEADMIERFDMVMYQPKKQTVAAVQIAFCSLCILLALASYLVVLQPFYEVPREEVYTDDSVIEMNFSEGFILKHRDGTYSWVKDNGDTYRIKEESVDFCVSQGIIIMEE